MTNLYNMKAIQVTHNYEGVESISYISFNQFEKSFVKERWNGERRYNKEYTLFGYVHTKTIVTNPYSGSKSKRVFKFPSSAIQAEKIHNEQMKIEE